MPPELGPPNLALNILPILSPVSHASPSSTKIPEGGCQYPWLILFIEIGGEFPCLSQVYLGNTPKSRDIGVWSEITIGDMDSLIMEYNEDDTRP